MRTVRHLLSALALTGLIMPAHAQTGIELGGSTLWAVGDKLYINGVGVGDQGNYEAGFQWDAASSTFRLIPGSVQASNSYSFPSCPAMRFLDMAADGTTRLSLGAEMLADSWSRSIQLTLTYGSTDGSFTFRPALLRLVQRGHTYTLADISSTANPHFVPSNGWLPNLEPLSQSRSTATARIVDFPADFDLTRAFYVYYGSGSPAAPAANGNDTYYYCGT